MTTGNILTTLRWTARVITIPIFLLWGAFFLEHLSWFSNPSDLPPLYVLLSVACHGLILVGLVLSWKWETIGSIVTIAAAAGFFSRAGAPTFLLLTTLTSIPAIIFLVLRAFESRANSDRGSIIAGSKTA
jgi:hypothetical protein